MKMKKRTIACLLAASLAGTTVAQEVNDVNTPLHLMKPQYDTPYGQPSVQHVKEVTDRVLRQP